MSDHSNPLDPAADTTTDDEDRMRQALGLFGDQPGDPPAQRREQDRRAHRFVKDGEVPVVVLNSSRERGPDSPAPVNRIAIAEAALRTERAMRERTERSLREMQATLQQLQTKLGHTDLEHREALAAERRGREQAEAVLAEAVAAREALEARLSEMEAHSRVTEVEPHSEPAGSNQPRQAKPRRKTTRSPVEREPQPVKWWLPSYKSKTRTS
jgi:hypothetical protein